METGHRIGFLDDPGGGGARLAGGLLSRRMGLFLYGVAVADDDASPRYDDQCFDLIISAGGRRSWPAVSRALSEMHRLVRSGARLPSLPRIPGARSAGACAGFLGEI